jgi:hypothetical protein
MKKYYINSTKITPKVADTVMDIDSIQLEGQTYVRLSEKPKGRSILRSLHNVASIEDKIIIYK